MRCKKHISDQSSVVGVCSTCLRDRLFALIAAQEQAQARARAQLLQLDNNNNNPIEEEEEDRREKSPATLFFPRSVSPYVKSGDGRRTLSDQLFYCTPQIGPTTSNSENSFKKSKGRFALFSQLFRSKPKKPNTETDSFNTTPSWFNSMISGHQRKPTPANRLNSKVGRRPCRNRDRGMSPARVSDCGGDEEGYLEMESGYSSEASKKTPQRAAPATATARRGGFRSNGHNVSGFNFCLSPLVRASPNRHWNKGIPPEMAVSGEIRLPAAKPHLSNASSFCANRSRKLADFGRVNSNY